VEQTIFILLKYMRLKQIVFIDTTYINLVIVYLKHIWFISSFIH